MSRAILSLVVFPGAGGGDTSGSTLLTGDIEDAQLFHDIPYPTWKRFAANDLAMEPLIAEFSAQVMDKVPQGPIYIVGISIGGHFGYAVALRLKQLGRNVDGFCAIDSYMISCTRLAPGWPHRAMRPAVELLRGRRIREFAAFCHSRLWRACLRLTGDRLESLLHRFSDSGFLRLLSAASPTFERELNMRLLIRVAAPWISSLDHNPAPLSLRSVLIRTPAMAGDDGAWQRRCPNIRIVQMTGEHQSLFESDQPSVAALRAAFARVRKEWDLEPARPRQKHDAPCGNARAI